VFLSIGDSNVGWVPNDGVNGAHNLLTMWYKDAFYCGSHLTGKDFVAIFGHHLKAKRKCVVFNVYALCILSEKVALCEELSSNKVGQQNMMWCFCGDFNVVRSANERKGVCERGAIRVKPRDLISLSRGTFCWTYQFLLRSLRGLSQMGQ